jgi:hypothetical protein
MTVNLSALAGAGQQFFDNNGVILSGGLLYTYAAGTTTPEATYTASTGTTANTNPIVLDSAGRVPSEIWLTTTVNYKFVLLTSLSVNIWTKDNIPGIASAADFASFVADLASTAINKGASLVGNYGGGTVQDSIAVEGNPVPVAGSSAAVTYKWEDSTRAAELEGGIWTDKVYLNWVFNKEFTAANSPVNTPDNSPATPLFSMAYNNGSQIAVCGIITDAIAHTSSTSTFGANIIARSDENLTNVKLVGMEIDVEFGIGTTQVNSGGLFLNIFNNASGTVPCILASGVGGGLWSVGVLLQSGFTGGTGFAISATSIQYGIDLGQALFTGMGILMGTGITHGVEFGSGGGGVSPIFYGDSSGNMLVQMGSGNLFAIKNNVAVNAVVIEGTGSVKLEGGGTVYFNGTLSSATATGGAATLPGNPIGFLEIVIAGTSRKLPYYAT